MIFQNCILAALAGVAVSADSVLIDARGFNFTNVTAVSNGTAGSSAVETDVTTFLTTTAYKTILVGSETSTVPMVSTGTVAASAGSGSSSGSSSGSGSGSAAGSAVSSGSASSTAAASAAASSTDPSEYGIFKVPNAIKPKAFIISMFSYESDIWYENLDFEHNITVPGLSPLYPWVHCTSNYSVCQFITGESEINAAASVTALTLSPLFDLSETYFIIAGIAGGEPSQVTLGSVTFSEYAVQVALEYEIDSREVPDKYNWTTGYYPYDTTSPLSFPGEWYGTEVFKINGVLRDRAFELASSANLSVGTDANIAFRELYDYAPANQPPSVVKCDAVTSDTYWSGEVLSFYFSNLTSIMTNGSATYCATAQEDNATLESMMRAHLFGLVDFSRIVLMRTISDFARAPPKYADDAVNFFNNVSQGGSYVSIQNIYNAALPFVQDVLENWDTLYSTSSFATDEYLGDVFGTLGGTPTFGSGEIEKALD